VVEGIDYSSIESLTRRERAGAGYSQWSRRVGVGIVALALKEV
jgi:hypothetical protein